MRLFCINRVVLANRAVAVLMLTMAFVLAVLFSGSAGRWMVQAFSRHPVYQGNEQYPEIALTVNVFWGEEYIPRMLDILRQEKVKATFFLGGTWVEKFPDLAARIQAEGHEVGSHGYAHPHPDRISRSANLRDIRKAEEIIRRATGVRPRLYAPPYGERADHVLQASEEAGYTTILWSIDTLDWQLPSPETIAQRVLSKAHNGAIVLMHPTSPAVGALPGIIRELRQKGYDLVGVSDLLEKLPNEHI